MPLALASSQKALVAFIPSSVRYSRKGTLSAKPPQPASSVSWMRASCPARSSGMLCMFRFRRYTRGASRNAVCNASSFKLSTSPPANAMAASAAATTINPKAGAVFFRLSKRIVPILSVSGFCVSRELPVGSNSSGAVLRSATVRATLLAGISLSVFANRKPVLL